MLTFERQIASRYFALSEKKRNVWPLFVGGTPPVLLVLTWAVIYYLEHAHNVKLLDLRTLLLPALKIGRFGEIIGSILIGFFVLLTRRLTIFTAISIFGLFLGTTALVIVLSVMSGFEQDLTHKIVGSHAHIEITRPDDPFTDYEAVRARIAKLPGVLGATPYLTNEVMITSAASGEGVLVMGIDPATVGSVTDLAKNTIVGDLGYLEHPDKLRMLGGAFFHDDDDDADLKPPPGAQRMGPVGIDGKQLVRKEPLPDAKVDDKKLPERREVPGVILGKELAGMLHVYLGDDVNLISPFGGIGPSGSIPKSKPFRVAGIFFSGMYEYDSKMAYVSLPAGQKFFTMAGEATGIQVKVADYDHTEQLVDDMRALLGKSYEVEDWKHLNRSLFSALKIEKILMFVLLCFIILVAAFSIIANGIMIVMRKGREVAILKSMGASDLAILRAFMLLGGFIGAVGTISGILVGVLGCIGLKKFGLPLNSDVYYITTLPVKMNAVEIATVFGAALAIALLATLYPAWMASRLKPVDGLRDAQV